MRKVKQTKTVAKRFIDSLKTNIDYHGVDLTYEWHIDFELIYNIDEELNKLIEIFNYLTEFSDEFENELIFYSIIYLKDENFLDTDYEKFQNKENLIKNLDYTITRTPAIIGVMNKNYQTPLYLELASKYEKYSKILDVDWFNENKNKILVKYNTNSNNSDNLYYRSIYFIKQIIQNSL